MLSGKFFQKWWAAEWFSMQRSTLFMFHVSWQFSFAWKSVEVRDNLWPLCRSGIIAFKKLCLAWLLSFILVIFTSNDKYEYQLKYRWWCPSESNSGQQDKKDGRCNWILCALSYYNMILNVPTLSDTCRYALRFTMVPAWELLPWKCHDLDLFFAIDKHFCYPAISGECYFINIRKCYGQLKIS